MGGELTSLAGVKVAGKYINGSDPSAERFSAANVFFTAARIALPVFSMNSSCFIVIEILLTQLLKVC